ncbi:MobP2 family relaxase [Culicoidibacter larvae]|uniref:Relaxase n=1 Tax=Culicoidibacter larvae TaxID=2579976 RepID=A0A5R8Q6X5_9FIRM|nr:MobP2 family relaxase [Culicoidibacter larvae]TLG71172.1 hypothetical protein FEZ08_11500 [Culicoidibacter larvae]
MSDYMIQSGCNIMMEYLTADNIRFDSNAEYESIIDYMTREEATLRHSEAVFTDIQANIQKAIELHPNQHNESLANYIEYMTRSSASESRLEHGKLFNAASGALSVEEQEAIVASFKAKKEKGQKMYLQVVSFDNAWLEKYGILAGNYLNEPLLRTAVRAGIDRLLTKEDFTSPDNMEWVGIVHYNTDNIHVHVAMMEENPVKIRGQFSQESWKAARSGIVAQLMMDLKFTKQIGELRNTLYQTATKTETLKEAAFLFKTLTDELPIRRIYYAHTKPKQRELIDQVTNLILKDNAEFQEYLQFVSKQSELYSEAYGRNSKNDYFEKQVADLRKRISNAVIAQAYERKKEIVADRTGPEKKSDKSKSVVLSKSFQTMTRQARRAALEQKQRDMQAYHDLDRDL